MIIDKKTLYQTLKKKLDDDQFKAQFEKRLSKNSISIKTTNLIKSMQARASSIAKSKGENYLMSEQLINKRDPTFSKKLGNYGVNLEKAHLERNINIELTNLKNVRIMISLQLSVQIEKVLVQAKKNSHNKQLKQQLINLNDDMETYKMQLNSARNTSYGVKY